MRAKHSSPQDQYSDVRFHPDCDVTEKGMEQGKLVGRVLQGVLNDEQQEQNSLTTVHVVTLPLQRALQTAQYALEEMPPPLPNKQKRVANYGPNGPSGRKRGVA